MHGEIAWEFALSLTLLLTIVYAQAVGSLKHDKGSQECLLKVK